MRRSCVCLMLLSLWLPATVLARFGEEGRQAAVRKRLLLRERRHEVGFQLAVTLNDEYAQNILVGLTYYYHPLDWLGAGIDALFGGSVATSLTDSIEKQVTASREWQATNPGRNYTLPRTGLRGLVLAKFSVTPFSGKLVFGVGHLAYVDFHINVGAGLAMISGTNGPKDTMDYAVLVGGGFRVFPTRYIAVNLEVMDYMIRRELNVPRYSPGGLDLPKGKRLTQNPAFVVGATVFFPVTCRRSP